MCPVTHQPEGVLEYSVLWRSVHCAHHGADGAYQAHAQNNPRVRGHDAEGEPILEHGPRNQGCNRQSPTCVLEALMQV